MRASVLAIVAILAIGLFSSSCTPEEQAEVTTVVWVNAIRTAQGLRPLRVDPELTALARSRSLDMLVQDYFSHVAPDGCDLECQFNRAGIPHAWAGEALGVGNGDPRDVIQRIVPDWQRSLEHYEILVGCHFTRVGVGIASSGGRTFISLEAEGAAVC